MGTSESRKTKDGRTAVLNAKANDGKYYWFHTPQADRDRSLRKLIEDFRHESQGKDIDGKKSSAKKLRSGRTIGM